MIRIEVVDPCVEFVTPRYAPDWSQRLVELVEECGRVSHKSERRIAAGSAVPFVRRIAIEQGHESILEHAAFTACLIGSRCMSHQLVRHRIASMTQESMRYCDYSRPRGGDRSLKIIVPPSVTGANRDVFVQDALASYTAYLGMVDGGVPPEDARYLLPNATKTEVYVTMNMRGWRHFIKTRRDKHAQWEIRTLAGILRAYFLEHVPVFFDDMRDLS